MSKKQYLISAILLVIAIASSWWIFSKQKPEMPKLASTSKLPDSYAEHITTNRYDKNGILSSVLTSPKLYHYKNKTIIFMQPHVTIYNGNQEPWQVQADKGKTKDSFDIIHLIGHVKLHQPAGKNNQDITITTSRLTLNTKTDIASTKAPITLYQRDQDNSVNIVKSVGIIANQKTGNIQLLSRARGYYAPANKK